MLGVCGGWGKGDRGREQGQGSLQFIEGFGRFVESDYGGLTRRVTFIESKQGAQGRGAGVEAISNDISRDRQVQNTLT